MADMRRSRLTSRALVGVLLACGFHASGAAGRPEVIQRTPLSHPCSRPISRQVRKQIEQNILRPAQKAGMMSWPTGCPLDPTADLWSKHEKQKQRKRGSGTQWTCGFCGKVFKSEHYLDLHMERRHMNETPRGGVCLADYCDMFDVCESDSTRPRKRTNREPECDNATMLEAQHRCAQALMRCLPLDSEVPRMLHAQYSKQYCRVLDCRIREERRAEEALDLMPVIVVLILILLIGFMVFSIMVCCVDYSDDILEFLVESGVASQGFAKRMTQTREVTRQTIGLDRTKCI